MIEKGKINHSRHSLLTSDAAKEARESLKKGRGGAGGSPHGADGGGSGEMAAGGNAGGFPGGQGDAGAHVAGYEMRGARHTAQMAHAKPKLQTRVGKTVKTARETGRIVHPASKIATARYMTEFFRKAGEGAYRSAESGAAGSDDAATSSIGYALKTGRYAAGGAGKVATAGLRGLKTAGKTKTAAKAKAAASRAVGGAKKVAAKAAQAVAQAVKHIAGGAASGALVPLVAGLLAAGAVMGAASGVSTVVAALFGGSFTIVRGDGTEEDFDIHEYLMAAIPPRRDAFIEEMLLLREENLAENGGGYHFVRFYIEGNEEEIPHDEIAALLYPSESLVEIIEPIFWAITVQHDLTMTEALADRYLDEMLEGILCCEAAPLEEPEWCGGECPACGYHHPEDDCPNFGHETPDGDIFYCPAPGGGANYCHGHSVLTVTVMTGDVYDLLDTYFGEPIRALEAVSPRTDGQEEELQNLKDLYELCFEYIEMVLGRLESGAMVSPDLSAVEWVRGGRAGSQAAVNLALGETGNRGGYKYWSFMGFRSRVSWCACFVSWCFDQMGRSEPRFSGVQVQGIPWFQSRGRFVGAPYYDLAPGDVIFFDWGGDGWADHTGLVIGRDAGYVYTVEGNSSDQVRVKAYPLDSPVIAGYGLPDW